MPDTFKVMNRTIQTEIEDSLLYYFNIIKGVVPGDHDLAVAEFARLARYLKQLRDDLTLYQNGEINIQAPTETDFNKCVNMAMDLKKMRVDNENVTLLITNTTNLINIYNKYKNLN